MFLNNLKSVNKIHRKKKLLGRGSGSGHGKTSTRGQKGQRSRSGRDFYVGFEGGQSPLIRRIPKRGFRHAAKSEYQLINVGSLKVFPADSRITAEVLLKKRFIRNPKGMIKILGSGELKEPLQVSAHKFSKSAISKIEKAGGRCLVLS